MCPYVFRWGCLHVGIIRIGARKSLGRSSSDFLRLTNDDIVGVGHSFSDHPIALAHPWTYRIRSPTPRTGERIHQIDAASTICVLNAGNPSVAYRPIHFPKGAKPESWQ
jgi:hypothetical protein